MQEVRNPAKKIQIDASAENQRIDNFLMTKLKPLMRSEIYKLIRTGQVRVNGSRIKPSHKLALGDMVRIPPVRSANKKVVKPKADLIEFMKQRILYEDESLIVLNKPSGMAVHGGSGVSMGVIECLRQMYPKAPYLELVHRLDKETSGCLLIAKTRKCLIRLHELLRENIIKKTYHALVIGDWQGGQKVVMPLHKNQLRSGERIVKVDTQVGKDSCTHFRVLKRYSKATLLEAKPITGRTHQIRVHAAFMGHAIVGDEKYGKREHNQAFQQWGSKRLFLHAYAIEIPREDSKPLKIQCELEKDLDSLLNHLSK